MKKIMKLTLMLIVALLVVVGCSDKDEGKTNNEAKNENNASNDTGTTNDDVDQVLQLGETGTMKDTTGEYEVTPTSFVVMEEWEGEVPKSEENVFVIVDVTVKNIGETVLDGKQLRKVDAIGGQDLVTKNNQLFDTTNQLEGELQPGEETQGQFAFSMIPTETYKLVLGMNLGSVSNEITWELDADKAS